MNMPIVGLLFVSGILGGCASYTEDAAVRQAVQEKETAYIRLAKAITSYCSASTVTMDARHACMVERRLAADHPENSQPIVPTIPSSADLRSRR